MVEVVCEGDGGWGISHRGTTPPCRAEVLCCDSWPVQAVVGKVHLLQWEKRLDPLLEHGLVASTTCNFSHS